MNNKPKSVWLAALTLLVSFLGAVGDSCNAKVWIPQIFQSGMVMQRQQTVPVWGTADSGETVTVTFRKKAYTATADADGHWRVELPAQKPGGPFTMQINDITIDDILVGDVWIVSGQSNVDTHLERVYPQYGREIDDYKSDRLRVFRVNTSPRTERQADVMPTKWLYADKQNCWHFSALGYFLGRKMLEETGVPQGVIQSSQGGTPIQAWLDLDSLTTENVARSGNRDLIASDYYTKYRLYTDAKYVELQSKANARAGEVWNKLLEEADPGLPKEPSKILENSRELSKALEESSLPFFSPDYDDSAWAEHDQFDPAWAKHDGRPITGSMWLRQHVHIDKEHAGKPATLNMGTLHDQDFTYVNGKFVGSTGYEYPPRRYQIPAGLLREGDNVIAVRIVCKGGMAHFYRNKPHELTFNSRNRITPNLTLWPEGGDDNDLAPVPLSFKWKTHEGAVMSQGALGGSVNTQNQASVLYNGMIHPLAPYAVSGIVWYQGESNTGRPGEYGTMLRMMMGNWRTLWGRDDLHFNIVQLANHMEPTAEPTESGWAALREQQRIVADGDPNASLTVAIDLGEAADIHPLRKRDVAERCALALSNAVHGKKNVLSPEPVEAVLGKDSQTVVVTMNQPLRPCAELCEFELADAQGKFHNVKASAAGRQVKLTVPDGFVVGQKVRFAWKNNPERLNLYGTNSLPASPFEITITK